MESVLTERVVEQKADGMAPAAQYPISKGGAKYSIFSEQYLEKPVISGDYLMALTPTACTIAGIPVIDDF